MAKGKSSSKEEEELILRDFGRDSQQNNRPVYHTLRYDFKPASVNSEEPATLELTPKGEVTIKAPNVGGSISSHTVFRGQRRPHVKECLLVIDNVTGEMVLQKLTDNITVKATRTIGGNSSGAQGNSNSILTTANNQSNCTNHIPNSHPQASGSSGSSSSSSSSSSGSSSNGSIGGVVTPPTTATTTTTNNSSSIKTNPPAARMDGPQLSEESSSSSESSGSRSRSSSESSSSSSSSSSSASSEVGFTF